ncbi:MAG: ABC transporter permease subunit [Trueperaceae bacterium]|nr:ABC transporter permease subunit [Trueperaceae bacterium]
MVDAQLPRRSKETSVPFWRNVKVIGLLAQIIFVLAIVAGIGVLVNNVVTALAAANLPADFSFLTKPAGIPIAERPIPYEVTDTYGRALLIGFLNTLKVAVVGVVVATFLGVLFGVMRLSTNWLTRNIASVYIEVLRNIPLAVQIVFWYSAILLPFPPRISDPTSLPGGILLSNIGLAFPALYPTYRFSTWIPYLIAGVLLAVLAALWRRNRLRRLDVVGRVWPYPVVTFLLVAGVGLGLSYVNPSVPDNLEFTFEADRGRGTTAFVEDGKSRAAAFVPVTITLPEATLTTTSQNLVESRKVVPGTVRFPLIGKDEASSFDVAFADPKAAEEKGLKLAFTDYPSIGAVYADRNGNDKLDPGEDIDPETGRGYGGVSVVMTLTDFHRTLVSDRDGQVRTPLFKAAAVAQQADTGQSGLPRPGTRFSAFGPQAAEVEKANLTAETEILPVGALVWSRVYVPVTNYEGGMRFTVNYLALLLALVIYTSAFIAEIVRGGILAVPKGQREAARAIGLSGYQTFTLIIFPQAMRIVLPPMISQYLNLTKNSSLAALAGYAELFVIASVISNQTGAAIPIALLLVGAYLSISLAFSVVLNQVNARLAIVER